MNLRVFGDTYVQIKLSMQKCTFAQQVQSKYIKKILTQIEYDGLSKCLDSRVLTMLWSIGTVINKCRAYFS